MRLATETPDLVPVLAVQGTYKPGVSASKLCFISATA